MIPQLLTTSAVSLGTVIATKAYDKAGDLVIDTVFDKAKKFLQTLRQKSPETVTAIEQVDEQPLDYGRAVLEIEAAARSNSEVAEAMQELSAAAKAQPPSDLENILQNIMESIESQSSNIENYGKMAEKIKAEKGATVAHKVEIANQTINYQ